MKMPSPMGPGARFATIPKINVPRSQFDMSHGHTTTFDVGKVIPITWLDVLPGDSFNIKSTSFMRLSTPVKPIMDNLYADIHFFFVPYRLLWENFTKMLGEQEDPGDSISYTVPQYNNTGTGYGFSTVEDYLGVPPDIDNATDAWTINALPRRAYTLIWDDWYRDENLQNSIGIDTGDGPHGTSNGLSPQPRGKRHDYFTTCLPWLQKGTAVAVGVTGESGENPVFAGVTSSTTGGFRPKTGGAGTSDVEMSSHSSFGGDGGNWSAGEILDWSDPGLEVNINNLRESLAVQKLLERSARAGTRYPEILSGVFGVYDPSQAVLQRPQFLGSSSCAIVVNRS
jgi:hypothetical protein